MKRLLLGLALVLAGCSHFTERQNCVIEGATIGAVVVGGGMAGGMLWADCGPHCVQWKIAHGESIHEAVQHHVNRTRDMIFYGALPGAAVGGIIGGLIGYETCHDEKPTSILDSLRRGN